MYQIVIPSYKRSSICNNQTLATLNRLGISKELINVFVIQDEYDLYKSDLNSEFYNEIIIGVTGLVAQRKFIEEYYPENTCILSIDDDITDIDLSMTAYLDLNDFIIKAFEDCNKYNSFIWGLYPVFNPFFRKTKKELSTNLNYIVGALYGYINRKNIINLVLDGNKEDVERTIKYYINDGVVLRYNKIGFKTKYYGSIGGLGTLAERVDEMKRCAIYLNETYPNLTRIKVRPNGLYEIVLKRTSIKK